MTKGLLPRRNHVYPEFKVLEAYRKALKTKVIWVDEDDIATYTIRAIVDPQTENRRVHIRPPANILSQGQVVEI